MGKIRIKTFDEQGNEEAEEKRKAKREAKKALRTTQDKPEGKTEKKKDKARVSGMGGGQRVKTVGPSIEELEAAETISASEKVAETSKTTSDVPEGKKSKKKKFLKEKALSTRFRENKNLVSKNQVYPLDKAVSLLTRFKRTRFDEAVELHVNTREQNISGTLKLPHGSGKTLKIKVADEALLSSIAQGKIDFDVLVATPDMMPKLAKVAKILGPKGLMPNPKSGTVTANPEETVKKLSGGEMRFKTESKAPIIHLLVGKVSFGEQKLLENLKAALDSIGDGKVKSATLSSTMSPGIKLQVN